MLAEVGLVVGAVLSAFFQVAFGTISPRTNLIEFLRRHEFNEILFENLTNLLLQANAVLSDAEEKQVTNPFVRLWVDELKDVAYHAVDLLDVIHSLAFAESQASSTQALDKALQNSKKKMEKMIARLENIVKHKDVLGLKESFSGKPSPRLQSTSLVDQSQVHGRRNDADRLLQFLLSDHRLAQNEIPTVAIVGIAGVGKTTLAQLLYNDATVQVQFETRAWVHVSEDFDVFKVTKNIIESVTRRHCDMTNPEVLQARLKSRLARSKFLIVLDDVWNESYSKWDALHTCLKVGATDSRIIATTRSQGVASTIHSDYTIHLQPLEDDDCWSVFADHAFGRRDASANLESIGREITRKCGGLPLAAKVLGSLLYSKVEVQEWRNVLNSHIWDLPNDKSDILPSLILSYHHLPSHLKQCFAYCSIFPKGYAFEKEKLVLLWMGEGILLQPKNDRTMEEIGIEYFNELVSKSFFQEARDGDNSRFIMHDLVNELAKFVSGEFCFNLERDGPYGISRKARHFSYEMDRFDALEKFYSLEEAKFLRTFLPLSRSRSRGSSRIHLTVVAEFLPRQKQLRVLSLSCYENISTLPDKLGELLHLRYLDLSGNSIKELPRSIGCLRNLQILILSQCIALRRLPAAMRNLIYLSHLDLNGTNSLEMMPREFGKLKSLQILTTFVVSNRRGSSSVDQLGGLSHLRGKLSILKLQNVRDVMDAENARLNNKENIRELEFSWSGRDDPDHMIILENLRPHENIEKVSIAGYGGTRLPDWLGDPSFSNMVILRLSGCRNCTSLASLGQLSSLQELYVKEMTALVRFYGNIPSSPFPSLQILKFEDMRNWIHWPSLAVTGGGFPSLKELHIRRCEYVNGIPNHLPSLESLIVNECRQWRLVEFGNYPELQTQSIDGHSTLR